MGAFLYRVQSGYFASDPFEGFAAVLVFLLTLGEVGRVLEQLLRERVSIRDFGSILEALLETASLNKSTEALVEAARQAMGRRLVQPLLDGEGQLPVLLLDASLEQTLEKLPRVRAAE